MTKLSVNINKIATLRNARGGNIPDVVKAAIDCQKFGAQGITVHPRPDERHIRYQDVRELRKNIITEFNIEGYPSDAFIDLVLEVLPHQVTLVPDPPDAITSNAGWDTYKHKLFLRNIVEIFKKSGIRTSIFIEPDAHLITHAADTGVDRIELYTEPFAAKFIFDKTAAVKPFTEAAEIAFRNGLGINAGHDLNLSNLRFFVTKVPHVLEVSIGHALIADALYYGLNNTIQMYLKQLEL